MRRIRSSGAVRDRMICEPFGFLWTSERTPRTRSPCVYLSAREHQPRAERYTQGERVRGVLSDVHKNPKGSQIILSRTAPELLMRLMEMEVPEIYDGTVLIRGCVRQPGDRAKVAVSSRERDVDPVGACVGMRGSRVQAIMRELRGERIDIIQYS